MVKIMFKENFSRVREVERLLPVDPQYLCGHRILYHYLPCLVQDSPTFIEFSSIVPRGSFLNDPYPRRTIYVRLGGLSQIGPPPGFFGLRRGKKCQDVYTLDLTYD